MLVESTGQAIALSERPNSRARFWSRAGLITLFAFIVHLILVTPAAQRLAPDAIDEQAWAYSWYYSDPWRVIESQTTDTQLRNNVHPFYGVVTNPPTRALMALAHLGPHDAVMALQRAIVFVMLLALTTLLLRLKHKTIDVALGALLVATSASLLFFTSMAESFVWGALSIFLALHILHRDEGENPPGVLTYVSAGLVSMGMTITNWTSALFGLLWERSWAKRALVLALTLAGAVAIVAVQKLVFAGSPAPSVWLINEANYISLPSPGLLMSRLETFLLYSQIAPAPVLGPALDTIWSPRVVSLLQPLSQAKIGLTGWLGWAAWGALLIWATFRYCRSQVRLRTVSIVALFVLFQCALHLVYGEAPFLYALHFTPFLAVFALEAMRDGRSRWIARGLALVTIVAAVPSNLAAFDASLQLIDEITPEVLRTRNEIRRRPSDFTPVRSGRVFISALNASIAEKGIVEPGGALSPAPGSFGLSIDGITSAAPTREELVPLGAGVGYRAETPRGRVQITPLQDGAWRYRINASDNAETIVVRLRGFGPAGRSLHHIERVSDRTIVLNHEWYLTFDGAPRAVQARDESKGGTFLDAREFSADRGWIELRVETGLPTLDLLIERRGKAPKGKVRSTLKPLPTVELDDPTFTSSIAMQTLSLAASVSDNETRPYDPLYADGAWPRDTAYTSVALAAAGQADLAKAIVRAALTKDFYGDHGTDAHAPGLSLWALDQVVRRTGDQALVAEAWPHVQRKVELMRRCADQDARGLFSVKSDSNFFPRNHYVCGPPLQGLVTGEIGLQLALSHATAFTRAGYAAAARMARQLGKESEAKAWEAMARRLDEAWNSALAKSGNNRAVLHWAMRSLDWLGDSLILNTKVLAQSRGQYLGCFVCNYYFDRSALWPTWVGLRSRPALAGIFADKHAAEWGTVGPAERYAEPGTAVALAHQLLYAGKAIEARTRLDWFLSHTQSPGLAQWGASDFNETPRGLWRNLRASRSAERLIEPSYWAAAEILLLQLDMLAYVVPGDTPALVVAAGSTPRWRTTPARVGPIHTELGPVCWLWDGQSLRVSAPDGVPIEAAGAFADVKPQRSQVACQTSG